MIPPLFSVCAANAGVTTLLGLSPVRLFPFGEAPLDIARPYAVWQSISGFPDNNLDELPESDFYSVQIDVYGLTSDSVLDVAQALRDAIEPVAYVTGWNNTSRDPDTKDFRFTFSADFIEQR
jgi:hypothetical protein